MTDQKVDETEAVVSPKWPLWTSRRDLSPEAQQRWDEEEAYAAAEEASYAVGDELVTDEDPHSHGVHDSNGGFPVR